MYSLKWRVIQPASQSVIDSFTQSARQKAVIRSVSQSVSRPLIRSVNQHVRITK